MHVQCCKLGSTHYINNFYVHMRINTSFSIYNSMRLTNAGKIGVGWTVLVVLGISGFVVSKSIIDKKRYDSMKSRQRMLHANKGEYSYPDRFEKRS